MKDCPIWAIVQILLLEILGVNKDSSLYTTVPSNQLRLYLIQKDEDEIFWKL